MQKFRFGLVIALVLGGVWLVSAQDDPRANEPNWCYDGNPWGDGRCNHTDPDIQTFNWNIGWLMAHCEIGALPADECPQPDGVVLSDGVGSTSFSFPDDAVIISIGGGIYTNGSIGIGGGSVCTVTGTSMVCVGT